MNDTIITAKEFRKRVETGVIKPKAKRHYPEHDAQVAIFNWAMQMSIIYPELRLLYSVPNGARVLGPQGKFLKAEGMRAGVPDMCLPVAHCGYHALYLENKSPTGQLSESQREWAFALKKANNLVIISHDPLYAKEMLEAYVTDDRTSPAWKMAQHFIG